MPALATAESSFSPPVWLASPFILLLLALSALPLTMPHFWEKRHQWIIALLGALPVVFYTIAYRTIAPYSHVLWEYFSFMVVVGGFFIVSGGFDLKIKGGATPSANCAFLLGGALLGNLIGATGASMLLIRPWIQANKYRFTGLHAAFFIFVVGNLGGALTPLGPPLFMGYLKGVPFWWSVLHCWTGWLMTIAMVLATFYLLDQRNFRRAPASVSHSMTGQEHWHARGLHQLMFFAAMLGAIIGVPDGYRELIILIAAVLSYFTTSRSIHQANGFTFAPVKEVGWIFLGIFATMKPVLDIMTVHAAALGLHTDRQFYWASGVLSGFLDNAPTYLTFLATAFGLHHLVLDNPRDMELFLASHGSLLVAISLGSACFGAFTYLGNAPNLMIKAICDQSKVRTPHFLEYLWRYSLPTLAPVFALVSWLLF